MPGVITGPPCTGDYEYGGLDLQTTKLIFRKPKRKAKVRIGLYCLLSRRRRKTTHILCPFTGNNIIFGSYMLLIFLLVLRILYESLYIPGCIKPALLTDRAAFHFQKLYICLYFISQTLSLSTHPVFIHAMKSWSYIKPIRDNYRLADWWSLLKLHCNHLHQNYHTYCLWEPIGHLSMKLLEGWSVVRLELISLLNQQCAVVCLCDTLWFLYSAWVEIISLTRMHTDAILDGAFLSPLMTMGKRNRKAFSIWPLKVLRLPVFQGLCPKSV